MVPVTQQGVAVVADDDHTERQSNRALSADNGYAAYTPASGAEGRHSMRRVCGPGAAAMPFLVRDPASAVIETCL